MQEPLETVQQSAALVPLPSVPESEEIAVPEDPPDGDMPTTSEELPERASRSDPTPETTTSPEVRWSQ